MANRHLMKRIMYSAKSKRACCGLVMLTRSSTYFALHSTIFVSMASKASGFFTRDTVVAVSRKATDEAPEAWARTFSVV